MVPFESRLSTKSEVWPGARSPLLSVTVSHLENRGINSYLTELYPRLKEITAQWLLVVCAFLLLSPIFIRMDLLISKAPPSWDCL